MAEGERRKGKGEGRKGLAPALTSMLPGGRTEHHWDGGGGVRWTAEGQKDIGGRKWESRDTGSPRRRQGSRLCGEPLPLRVSGPRAPPSGPLGNQSRTESAARGWGVGCSLEGV